MNRPLVSVCLPNLNTRAFLEERVCSITNQTYTNWELIVSDNYSEDGAWEFFETLARNDARVSVAQAPREGMYPNWNRCIDRARGEFVYVATSDDGMAPDCLEKLVRALESHPDCDVAHCALTVVDEAGRPIPDPWWPERTVFGRSAPELVDRMHVRRAPYDGLLCLSGEHVYYSITETLIRRSLFARIGRFESRWGSVSDFHWHMRVGLVTHTVHVPDTWATWRLHPNQATALAGVNTPEYGMKIDEMIDDAVRVCWAHLAPPVQAGLESDWLAWSREMRTYYRGLRHRPSALDRRLFQMMQLFAGEATVRSEILGRVLGRPKWSTTLAVNLRAWLESVGAGPVITVDDTAVRVA